MTDSQFLKEIKHWESVIKKINRKGDKRGYNTTDERQERYLAEAKIEEITEQERNRRLTQMLSK